MRGKSSIILDLPRSRSTTLPQNADGPTGICKHRNTARPGECSFYRSVGSGTGRDYGCFPRVTLEYPGPATLEESFVIKAIQTSATRILTCLLATLLVGCATTSVPDRSNAASNLPDDFTLYGPVTETSPRWWESFDSPELNAWVDEALSDNFSIRQAYARINQASAIARQSQSFLAPQANYSLDTSITANHSDDASAFGPGNDNNTVTTRSYRPGASVSYEVDLWGRIGAGADAASLDETAARLDLQTAMHSVAGSITLTWLDLIEVHQILNVTQRQLETNKTNLELNELRFRKGNANYCFTP